MRDPESRTKRDFSHFDTMSTAELRSVIHHDSMLDENEASDMDAILYIMEVLAKRDKEENEYIETDAAWQSFKTDYYPYASDGEPLFSADDGEDTAPVRRR